MARKAMIYSLFAIMMVASAIALLSFRTISEDTPTIEASTKIRTDQMNHLSKDIKDDYTRAAQISADKSPLAAVSYIFETGEYLTDASESLKELYQHGTIEGEEPLILNSTIGTQNWTELVEALGDQTSLAINIESSALTINTSGTHTLKLTETINIDVYDQARKTRFNRTHSISHSIHLEDIDDPLTNVKSAGYLANKISECPPLIRSLANGTGSGYGDPAGYVYGGAYVCPGCSDFAAVEDKSDKILVIDDLAGDEPGADVFAGIVTEGDAPVDISNYISGATGAVSSATNGRTLVLDGTNVRENNALYALDTGCFFGYPEAPTFMDRMEGRDTQSGKYGTQGIATFVDVTELPELMRYPDKSIVDFRYFDGIGSVVCIKGASDNRTEFRLYNIDTGLLGLSELEIAC